MKKFKIDLTFNYLRAFAIIAGLAAIIFLAIKAHAHTLDIEPWTYEAETSFDRARESQDRDHYDNCKDKDNGKDCDRCVEYDRSHMS